MHLDHVVLWVTDPARSLEFYVKIVGLEPVGEHEFAQGRASFPSVRVNSHTILDLMNRDRVASVRSSTGNVNDSGGTPINHVCLSMTAEEQAAMETRLEAHGIEIYPGAQGASGALGDAARSVYWNDPDGNVIEIRHYDL